MSLCLLDFTKLDEDQKEMILSWRNNPSIRKYMYNSNEISEQEHTNFIQSLENREDKLYFLVQKDALDIGVIDFNKINGRSAIIGLYANPNLDKKGIGSVLMEAILEYAFEALKLKYIKAEVFADNERAYSLYKKFGFCERRQKKIGGREVIYMELRQKA